MIWLTSHTKRGFNAGSAHSGSSWKRNSTVLSGGTFQTCACGGSGPLGPSGSRMTALPPPAPVWPWQSAHDSDLTGLYASICELAKSSSPRSSDALSKYASECSWRTGSRSRYTRNTIANAVTKMSAHPSTRSRRRPSRVSSSKNATRFGGAFSSSLRFENVAHSR